MDEHICRCAFCVETRLLANEFNLFKAKTALQKRMKKKIKEIEDRVKDDPPPYEESNRTNGFWYY